MSIQDEGFRAEVEAWMAEHPWGGIQIRTSTGHVCQPKRSIEALEEWMDSVREGDEVLKITSKTRLVAFLTPAEYESMDGATLGEIFKELRPPEEWQ